jgi:signal transduction histidine kinase
MSFHKPADSETLIRSEKKIEALEQQARELARSAETVRQQTLAQTNERIETLEQKARDLACFVETTRQQTLLQSDKKTEALEQKARDLADFVETLRNQTRVQSETEIEALGQKARDLALFVETVRKETRLRSETEIALLGRRARDLAVSVETVREETLLHTDTEIAALGQQARELAISVETVREETLLHTDTEIKGLKQQAHNLALSVEKSRIQTLMESDKVIRKLNEELEQRVLERTGQLEAANKELEAFSYSVSHDLRAPLRGIDGFSRILLDEETAQLSEQAKNYLQLIRDNTQQMGRLVDDLLAFSRLSRQPITTQQVDVTKLVGQCLDELLEEHEERRMDITVGDLPVCRADRSLLKQVWINLLSNALKYTRRRDKVLIEVGGQMAVGQTFPSASAGKNACPTEAPAGTLIFFVKDNGVGFDMRYASKLFGVFQRLHRAEDYEGTGVGLAIVQRIIHRHGGRVWAEAKPNEGATFYFSLDGRSHE